LKRPASKGESTQSSAGGVRHVVAARRGRNSHAQKKGKAEGCSGDTWPEKLLPHDWEHAPLRKVRQHAGRPAHADQGGGAILRRLLPTLFATDAERNTYEAVDARNQMTPKTLRFAQLSPARQQLVRICQTVNYGQINVLLVRDGEPIYEPPPVVVIDAKLFRDDGPRPELGLADFELRDDVRRLMARLDEMREGMIERIEVRAGMPRRVLFRTTI